MSPFRTVAVRYIPCPSRLLLSKNNIQLMPPALQPFFYCCLLPLRLYPECGKALHFPFCHHPPPFPTTASISGQSRSPSCPTASPSLFPPPSPDTPAVYIFRALSGQTLAGRLHNSSNLGFNHPPPHPPPKPIFYSSARHSDHTGRRLWGADAVRDFTLQSPGSSVPSYSSIYMRTHTPRCTHSPGT